MTYSVIQQHSYNSLVDKIVSSDPNSTSEQAECDIIRKFLKDTSSQLTYYGLIRLNDPVIHFKDNQFAIFFRNNHFSVLYKDKGRVFVLVTDEGFCTTTNSNNCNPSPYRYRGAEAPFQRDIDRQDMETVVWEHLSEVSG